MSKMLTSTARGILELPEGHQFEYVRVQYGLLPGWPYVTVKQPNSDITYSSHFHRFSGDKEFLEEEFNKLKQEKP